MEKDSASTPFNTKSAMTRAVKNSEMAAAAIMAIDVDSSIIIRLANRFSTASLKIGQPPITRPATPMMLTGETGSESGNHTHAALLPPG